MFKYIYVFYVLIASYNAFAFSKETKIVTSPFTQESYKVSVLTPSDVDDLFLRFVNNTLIPWEIVHDGCFERAYLMITQAQLKSVYFGKTIIEVINPEMAVLQVKANELPKLDPLETSAKDLPWIIRWQYHVAPYVFVKIETGEIKKVILDPSLFTSPVSVDVFISKLTSDPKLKFEIFDLPPYVETQDQLNSKVNLEFLDRGMLAGMSNARAFAEQHGKYLEKTPILDSNQNLCYQGGLLVDLNLCSGQIPKTK